MPVTVCLTALCIVLLALEGSDPDWYLALTSVLTDVQAKSLQEVFHLAEQRKASLGEDRFP